VEGDSIVAEWDVFFGGAYLEGPMEPWVEVSIRSESMAQPITKRFQPSRGNNRGREIIATGLESGRYDVWLLLWGHNEAEKRQVNENGAGLEVEVP
jgi:hypothetical protein